MHAPRRARARPSPPPRSPGTPRRGRCEHELPRRAIEGMPASDRLSKRRDRGVRSASARSTNPRAQHAVAMSASEPYSVEGVELLGSSRAVSSRSAATASSTNAGSSRARSTRSSGTSASTLVSSASPTFGFPSAIRRSARPGCGSRPASTARRNAAEAPARSPRRSRRSPSTALACPASPGMLNARKSSHAASASVSASAHRPLNRSTSAW